MSRLKLAVPPPSTAAPYHAPSRSASIAPAPSRPASGGWRESTRGGTFGFPRTHRGLSGPLKPAGDFWVPSDAQGILGSPRTLQGLLGPLSSGASRPHGGLPRGQGAPNPSACFRGWKPGQEGDPGAGGSGAHMCAGRRPSRENKTPFPSARSHQGSDKRRPQQRRPCLSATPARPGPAGRVRRRRWGGGVCSALFAVAFFFFFLLFFCQKVCADFFGTDSQGCWGAKRACSTSRCP